jgi:hypothetical protein
MNTQSVSLSPPTVNQTEKSTNWFLSEVENVLFNFEEQEIFRPKEAHADEVVKLNGAKAGCWDKYACEKSMYYKFKQLFRETFYCESIVVDYQSKFTRYPQDYATYYAGYTVARNLTDKKRTTLLPIKEEFYAEAVAFFLITDMISTSYHDYTDTFEKKYMMEITAKIRRYRTDPNVIFATEEVVFLRNAKNKSFTDYVKMRDTIQELYSAMCEYYNIKLRIVDKTDDEGNVIKGAGRDPDYRGNEDCSVPVIKYLVVVFNYYNNYIVKLQAEGKWEPDGQETKSMNLKSEDQGLITPPKVGVKRSFSATTTSE